MDKWDELRTADALARLGTVSGAADALGVHRATVVRHVDTLEAELGVKLFQRHGRGYTLTEAGEELARVAAATAERFHDLAGRVKGLRGEVAGELVLTSVDVLAPLLLRSLAEFRQRHPDTTVRFETSERVFKLEYGEAHVAVRSGSKPTHPDNVVQPFGVLRSALYAHRSYVEQYGEPPPGDFRGHHVISDARADGNGHLEGWLSQVAPRARVAFSSRSGRLRALALRSGLGIGFCPVALAEHEPDWVQVHPSREEWDVPFWLVTHVDLHRTAKVQAALQVLRGMLPS